MKLLDSVGLKRFGIQLAAGGKWENALVGDDLDFPSARNWITAAGPNIAIESLFCDASRNRAGFIGFRRSVEHEHDRCRFWIGVIEKTKPLRSLGPKEHIALWLDLLGQPSLLASPSDKIELGVWNQWKSAGAVPLHSERLTESDMRHGPDWSRQGATAPIVREQQWNSPQEFWIGEVLSKQRGERFFLPSSMLPE